LLYPVINGQSTCRWLDRIFSILADPHNGVVYGVCGDHLNYTLGTCAAVRQRGSKSVTSGLPVVAYAERLPCHESAAELGCLHANTALFKRIVSLHLSWTLNLTISLGLID